MRENVDFSRVLEKRRMCIELNGLLWRKSATFIPYKAKGCLKRQNAHSIFFPELVYRSVKIARGLDFRNLRSRGDRTCVNRPCPNMVRSTPRKETERTSPLFYSWGPQWFPDFLRQSHVARQETPCKKVADLRHKWQVRSMRQFSRIGLLCLRTSFYVLISLSTYYTNVR